MIRFRGFRGCIDKENKIICVCIIKKNDNSMFVGIIKSYLAKANIKACYVCNSQECKEHKKKHDMKPRYFDLRNPDDISVLLGES